MRHRGRYKAEKLWVFGPCARKEERPNPVEFAVEEFDPPQAKWNMSGAVPKVMGSATLEGPWVEVPAGGNSAYRFFKVEVVLP